jgi:DNA-binding transcriptional MocR family regulator
MEEIGLIGMANGVEGAAELPVYRRIADSIAARIARGEIKPGDRLPNHRDLASEFRVNVTTITRAFHTLKRRGLVETRPGRGTLVLDFRNGGGRFQSSPTDDQAVVDLTINRPATSAYLEILTDLMPRLPRDRRFPTLKDYQTAEGPLWLREAAAPWLRGFALAAEVSTVLAGAGAQHALSAVIDGLTRPGDVVLADEITYMGLIALCRARGIVLRGLSMDRDGMRPDAFEEACQRWQPRLVFLMPSLQNPTAIAMPESRRRALAAVARRFNVLVVEDDVYAPMVERRPPSFAALEPELTIHINSLSKCVAPGLRIGFVVTPRALAGDVTAAFRVACWNICPMSALVATMLLETDAVGDIIAAQQQELRERNRAATAALAPYGLNAQPEGCHAWLTLTERWRGDDFSRACAGRGVMVLSAETFAIGREAPPNAVRFNLAAARSREELKSALAIMVDLLGAPDC